MKPAGWLPLRYLLVGAAGLVVLLPFAWMVSASLMTPAEMMATPPPLLPADPQWDNFRQVATVVPLGRVYLNSLVVAGLATLGVLATSTLGGFALAKYRFAGRQVVFLVTLVSLMVPTFSVVIPLFWIVRTLGWLDSYAGLIVPFMFSGYGVFMMRQFLLDFPDELLDAARIDGASEPRILGRIVVPLIGPSLATLGAFTFISVWNTFLWPLLIIRNPNLQTLPLALNSLREYGAVLQYRNLQMAGTVLGVIPALVGFAFLQRWFSRGFTLGGLK